MNFPFFVTHRTVFKHNRAFAATIVRLAVAAYALSIAVMIIAMALTRGFKKEISEKMFGCWGHIHVQDIGADRSFEPKPIVFDPFLYEQIENLSKISYKADRRRNAVWTNSKGTIDHIQVFTYVPGIISKGDEFEGVILKGVDEDFDWGYLQAQLDEGTVLDLAEKEASDGILVSQYTADRMGLKLDDKFIVHFIRDQRQMKKRFTLTGIYSTGLSDFDQKFAIIDIAKAREITSWDDDMIGGYEVFVDDISDADIFNEYIYAEILPSALGSESITNKFPNIFDWLELQNMNEIVILGLMLLVASINLIIMLLIIILERTRMIGILKALGSTNWTLRKIFLYKAAYIMVVGTLIGNIIGIGLCLIQDYSHFIKLDEESYFLEYAPIHLNPLSILLVNLLAISVCLLILIIPSSLIAKIRPSELLRFG